MKARVLLLAGVGRSGSTLLSRLLGQVRSTCAVGELCFLWDQGVLNNRQCGCGAKFADCPFWTQVGEHAFGGWTHVDAHDCWQLRRSVERIRFVPALATGAGTKSFTDRVRRYGELMSRVYTAVAEVSGSEVVVDSSKYPSSAYLARRAPSVDLRILHLVRRSEGVAYSWSKYVRRPDRDGKPLAQFSPVRTAVDWNVYNLLVDGLPIFHTPRLRVRYEDFIANPTSELERILSFAGLKVPPEIPDVRGSEVILRNSHSVAGNPMRFRTGVEQLRPDDQWRTDMPVSTRRLVTALTLPGLVRYGYAPTRTRA